MDNDTEHGPLDPLTQRELEILRCISDRMSDQEIAQEFYLSVNTVKWYNRQIYSKLGVSNRRQAAARAESMGLLTSTDDFPRLIHNLPAPVTSFIGRESEIAQVRALLEQPAIRLVTLTGPPGTGKTRLAVKLAHDLLDDYPHGVFFVDLAPVRQPVLVAVTIANTLNLLESTKQSIEESLLGYLKNKKVLLLLDNFEHVMKAVQLVAELVSAARHVKVLVTSREALRVYGEHEYSVPPLRLPGLSNQEPWSVLSQYEAVTLFVQRAQAVKANFNLTDENASAVVEICVRLDGLPLAIELAAARTKLLSPQALIGQLGSRLTSLHGGFRGLPQRQQTLTDTIAWSYELLDGAEKKLFARLSVFQGGRTIEAVEAVCYEDPGITIIDGLESLLNKSLLKQDDSLEGEPRFVMLETIHEFARECLVKMGESEVMHHRHAAYFLSMVEQAEPELQCARQRMWSKRLRAEHNNLQSALAWSLDGETAETVELGMRLIGSLGWFWYDEGYFVEGLRWAEHALEHVSNASPIARAKLLNVAGFLAYGRGDYDRGKRWHHEAVALFQEMGDKVNSAWALIGLALHSQGNAAQIDGGISLCEEALALFQDENYERGIARAYLVRGMLAQLVGDFDKAADAFGEAVVICRAINGKRDLGVALNNLGQVVQWQGDYVNAERLMKEGLAHFWELETRYFTASAISALAGPASATGRAKRAARLLGAAEALFEDMGVGYQPTDQVEIGRYADMAREQLDESTFAQAWAEGRAMPINQAVAFALEEPHTRL